LGLWGWGWGLQGLGLGFVGLGLGFGVAVAVGFAVWQMADGSCMRGCLLRERQARNSIESLISKSSPHPSDAQCAANASPAASHPRTVISITPPPPLVSLPPPPRLKRWVAASAMLRPTPPGTCRTCAHRSGERLGWMLKLRRGPGQQQLQQVVKRNMRGSLCIRRAAIQAQSAAAPHPSRDGAASPQLLWCLRMRLRFLGGDESSRGGA